MPDPFQPDLLIPDDRGLCCAPGGFHIDPWRPVETAVITHAHGDHARPGSGRYFAAEPSVPLLRIRLGAEARISGVPFGEPFQLGDTTVAFHPAGHVLGSAQVRVQRGVSHGSEVWVASGDYKRDADPVTEPFEVVPCDVFITEATFALPIYRFSPAREAARQIREWWMENRAAGRPSVLFAYALGKAQRVLGELRAIGGCPDEPVLLHGAAVPLTRAYRDADKPMLATEPVTHLTEGRKTKPGDFAGRLILAPPSAAGSPWMRRFGPPARVDTGFVSGWMQLRGVRRRRGYDRGFVMSDHADWDDLLRTIRDTGAQRVLATHGYTDALSRHLRELGYDAAPLRTAYGSDDDGSTETRDQVDQIDETDEGASG